MYCWNGMNNCIKTFHYYIVYVKLQGKKFNFKNMREYQGNGREESRDCKEIKNEFLVVVVMYGNFMNRDI